MRCAMARGIASLVLGYSLTWSILLTSWTVIGDKSLTGVELSQTLTLLPAIAILIALIALYRKFPRLLTVLSGLVMALAGVLAITTNFLRLPAALALQESLTGIAGDSSLGTATVFPTVYAILALVSFVAAIFVSRLHFSKRPSIDDDKGLDDLRGVWDQQS